MVSAELLNTKLDEDILKCLHDNFKHYSKEYRDANGITLTMGKLKVKASLMTTWCEARKCVISEICGTELRLTHIQKMDEHISIHNDSGLKDLGDWDFLFTLPYQSTDESAQSDDDHGWIDPGTDKERDIKRGTLLAGRAKGEVELVNKVLDHLDELVTKNKPTHHQHKSGYPREKDLPDVKTGSEILSVAIDPIWLDDHLQDQLHYVEITDRLIENYEDEDLY
ncbi:hypothetical protein PAXRUDRAFT_28707 [Paxillus rubicundulus Ve08.2h10]|uniref:Uncharacterized protein n=1 Tax=Paxillus rubicundulus Ve08.2h10 TaxID=930991 RepID=A0A0D0CRM4_9AGAM|nr:hypothetical protein PAXRUDRAFT_28707 [Paxillus rubicundulus Ve08.2h10]